ncbi:MULTISPECIES: hypothetical protein [unclassified Xanthomonas]|uniref:hypothetical protein n=1 Tax=unclassified Xanthomonas TaxID=2643310 RepID=UPI002B23B2C0|nr:MULTISPECIES: hypothetical protein [unclassified Xanthomonas]MEA9564031.1 hypothetical protein [Xanthomonas sp. WHRI 8932A]MEA9635848.1 hypothetical protein [Xanthomonas sp. WHRI 8812E]
MKRPLRSAWLAPFLLLMLLTGAPALATGDIVAFEVNHGPYSFLVYSGGGEDGIGGLVVYWPNIAARSLPPGSTKWRFKPESSELRVTFTNPGRKDLPPSFILNIVGKRGTLTYGKRVLPGNVTWMSGPMRDY